ncbi:MAG: hypothetical protein R3F30_15890, partial [Planctomycetota bacterium]
LGKLPSDKPYPNIAYWSAVMTAADKAGDAKGFADGWKRLKERYTGNLSRLNAESKARVQEMIDRNDKRQAELEAAEAAEAAEAGKGQG